MKIKQKKVSFSCFLYSVLKDILLSLCCFPSHTNGSFAEHVTTKRNAGFFLIGVARILLSCLVYFDRFLRAICPSLDAMGSLYSSVAL